MKRHLNTLYVTTDGTYLAKEGECIVAKQQGTVRARIPVSGLESVVCFGRVSYSPQVLEHCAQHSVAMSHLSGTGRFLARLEGPTSGNVLVRRAQYRWADDPQRSASVARSVLAGKVSNARYVLQRAARERSDDGLGEAVRRLEGLIRRLERENDLDRLRGIEGEAGLLYWSVFPRMIGGGDPAITFAGRSRRPPMDPMNAVLSFLYTLLVHDVRGALEAAGLDPQVGFLHRDRPGRPSLALDMMEEFRAVVVDRLALTLVNRGQLRRGDFTVVDGGGVHMSDDARRVVISAWQEKKKSEKQHPFLGEVGTIGVFWHWQALLLKRHLRGDLDAYPPCLWR